eukprot:scaffold5297_cov374-Prasinococcus_capsulatus_cf.AAC.4
MWAAPGSQAARPGLAQERLGGRALLWPAHARGGPVQPQAGAPSARGAPRDSRQRHTWASQLPLALEPPPRLRPIQPPGAPWRHFDGTGGLNRSTRGVAVRTKTRRPRCVVGTAQPGPTGRCPATPPEPLLPSPTAPGCGDRRPCPTAWVHHVGR